MAFWNWNIGLAFVISVVFTGVLIPQILLVSFRKKLFDQPDARKIHHSAVPRLGGIAFMPVALFTIAFLLGVSVLLGHGEMVDGLRGEVLEFSFALCALILLYLVGMADDLIGVQYRAKFAVQILCAVLLVTSGVWINNLYGLFGIHELPRAVGWPLTVFVVVFVINAVNLIDGIDGLASGLSGVALFFYGVVFIGMGRYMYAMLAFVTLGALVSFFYYNVFGNAEKHKKIFMGDTGSLTIGIILSFLCVSLARSGGAGQVRATAETFVWAFVPLIVPCFDVVRVVLHRARNHKQLFMPDMNHIHHKLLRAGMPQRRAMLTILSTSVVFVVGNVLLCPTVNVNILLLGDVLVWTVANIWLSKYINKRESGKEGAKDA